MTIFLRRIRHPLIVATGAMAVGFVALVFFGLMRGFDAEAWASWVQALGSIAAILISLGLVAYQVDRQYLTEQARSASNDLRISLLADGIVRHALIAVAATRRAQINWPASTPFAYRDQPRIHGALEVIRNLLAQPLPSNMIGSVMATHTLLVDVDTATVTLIGHATFKSNTKYIQFWNKRDAQSTKIPSDIAGALAANRKASVEADRLLAHLF